MTEFGFTNAPGRRTIRSTRESVRAGIQRISSGTSVPRPRTSRSIGPRFTTSVQTVPRSTDGAAGRSRESPLVTPAIKSAATLTYTILLILLALAFDGLGMSIAFLTICSSVWSAVQGNKSQVGSPRLCPLNPSSSIAYVDTSNAEAQVLFGNGIFPSRNRTVDQVLRVHKCSRTLW